MVLLELLFHHIFQLMRVLEVHGDHAQRIADEIHGEMVVQNLGILLENARLFRVFDMLFERDHPLGAHQFQDEEEKRQQVFVILSFPFRAFEGLAEVFQRCLYDITLVGNEERADSGTTDRHEFMRRRLENDADFAAGNDIAAKNHRKYKHKTNYT